MNFEKKRTKPPQQQQDKREKKRLHLLTDIFEWIGGLAWLGSIWFGSPKQQNCAKNHNISGHCGSSSVFHIQRVH